MSGGSEDSSARPQSAGPLSSLLEACAEAAPGRQISVRDVLELLGDRSIWALLIVLALPMALPIPLPGLSVPFGACMILVSAQLAMGRSHVWLPAALVRRSVDGAMFARLVRSMLPTLKRLEKAVRPRSEWMVAEWMRVPVGGACLVLAIIIALPIPLGHVVPGTAISLFSLGMIERDGLVVWLGLAVAVAGIALVILASAGLMDGIVHLWRA